jgi:hypothetical protein
MYMINIPQSPQKVHHGLITLRDYALRHAHSRQWLGALAILLTREVSHG